MKRLLPFLAALAIIVGCAVQPCIVSVPQNGGTKMDVPLATLCDDPNFESVICETGKKLNMDPCILHRTLEFGSKEGYIFHYYTVDQFKAIGEDAKSRIRVGMQVSDLTIILYEFAGRINSAAGAQIIIIADTFLNLPQTQLLKEGDVVLSTSSIDDLIKEVVRISTWLGGIHDLT